MIKKILITGISMLCTCAIASTEQSTSKEIRANAKKFAEQSGIKLPNYNEINIVSVKSYTNNKAANKSSEDIFLEKQMKKFVAMHNEQLKKGYVHTDNPRSKELRTFKNTMPYKLNKVNPTNPEDTNLRESSFDLKIAYAFKGVPENLMTKNLGVVPYGSYKSIKNGDLGDGWSGTVQFFDANNIGSCAFTEHNRMLSQVGVELIKEFVTYEVQNKPTVALVEGSKKSGFVYKLSWYDTIFTRELECANKNFSPQIMKSVIDLANQIDS